MARILIVALSLVLIAAAVAVAAPDRSLSVSAEAPAIAWDGNVTPFSLSPTPSQRTCTKPAPGRFCDETLIEIKAPGSLEVKIDGWNEESDLDMFLLTSDADGSFGDEVGSALNEGPGPEKITAKVTPGFYLVFVNYFQAVNTGYKGTATLKASVAAAAPEPAPSDPAAPAPAPAPQPSGDSGALAASGPLAVDLKVSSRKLKAPRATVSCTVVCKARLQLVVDRKTARKLKLGRKATVVGRASATIDRKQPAPIAIKLTKKAKRAFKKARSVKATLKATVTDSSGGQRKRLSAKAALKR